MNYFLMTLFYHITIVPVKWHTPQFRMENLFQSKSQTCALWPKNYNKNLHHEPE